MDHPPVHILEPGEGYPETYRDLDMNEGMDE